MATKMLIDAAHEEETRVVVVRDGKVEEFDFEAASRKQLRGNIYLAKVTRVEPSLQAAFVDYGGNRHGFLAFSEIHPDYYQIPHADRQALIAEQAAQDTRDAEEAEDEDGQPAVAAEEGAEDNGGEESTGTVEIVATGADDSVESVGSGDALEDVPVRKPRPLRSYKIQEVIKKRQILLVQVVKEERGTKGAALTTYLSLAGRFSVLMPNTGRGGGISRKITNPSDRKRLKSVAAGLDVPEGMGVILRTAGASRTKAEIKRDFEYLLRLWENVRELTLESVAPTLVYEEGSLVKRAIRDLYTKDISQVLVNGDAAYREAKDFMRMLMPSHAKHVQPYRDVEPIFLKHNVEGQLDAMFSPRVTLKSGGYVIINQTEALVAIDVNSGRSTREHNIEDTALKTNLEAAEEIARQLRLRDLAGLIVIDFIDMEEKRNNRSVERRLKEALKNDRARIQVGRISHFGLLEMSRQRIRFGVLESSLQPCPHCEGTGLVRSVESVALFVLRSIEYELRRGKPTDLVVRVRTAVALYILNQKREYLAELEALGVSIRIEADEAVNGAGFSLEKGEPARPVDREGAVQPVSVDPDADPEEVEAGEGDEVEDARAESDSEDQPRRKGRRRRRRRTGEAADDKVQAATGEDESEASGASADSAEDSDADSMSARRRRRGRRGGRRHRRDQSDQTQSMDATTAEDGQHLAAGDEDAPTAEAQPDQDMAEAQSLPDDISPGGASEPVTGSAEGESSEASAGEAEESAKPAPKRRAPRRKKAKAEAEEPQSTAAGEAGDQGAATEPGRDQASGDGESAAPPIQASDDERPVAGEQSADTVAPHPEEPGTAERSTEQAEETQAEETEAEPPKRGWWQRRSLFGG